MNETELRAFLDLLMCSDPSPVPEHDETLVGCANRLSREHGFTDWIEAFHLLGKK